MKTVKVSELTGAALDWAVAKCEGATDLRHDTVACWWFTLDGKDRVLSRGWSAQQNYAPSTDWAQGGPIIEREKIATDWSGENDWCASCDTNPTRIFSAATPLIAAMRCYVASKLGDTVDVPKELV